MYRTNPLLQPFLLLIDLLGYLLFFWLRFRRCRKPKRILLIRLEHIGDVLLSTPAFRAVRKHFPGARIDILVRDFTAPLVRKNPNIDRVIVWNAPWLSKGGSWRGVRQVIAALRKERYDLAIDFHGDPRNIVLASLVARCRIGFGVRGFGFLLNKVVRFRDVHIIDRNLSLAYALGAPRESREMDLPISRADRKAARRLMPKGKVVALAPGTGPGRQEKLWRNDSWAELADRLIEHGVRVVFIGAKADQPLVDGILRRMRHADKAVSLCGRTTILQAAAVIERCALLIGIDAAPSHFARAVHTPLVSIFVSEDPRVWGYSEPRFTHVKGSRDALTAERVLEKVQQLRVL